MEEGAEKELEKRSKFLKSLIQNKKTIEQQEQQQHFNNNVKVRACDMPLNLQNHAFRCAFDLLDSMPSKNRDTKRLALTLKKLAQSMFLGIRITKHVSISMLMFGITGYARIRVIHCDFSKAIEYSFCEITVKHRNFCVSTYIFGSAVTKN
ncbi:dynein light chain type 1 family protein [Trifolium pratense]|uniref:Dynein light chain type 1 family protein n=1 Tax=Trifolium pratense TaxID=57577 RepID=A0A2K3LDD5_TRIPR|nr:dynein light chain type 1 family protein [Trifolium pratense]